MTIIQDKIQEINEAINEQYTVVGFVNNEFTTLKSRCLVECKTHGNGSTWGNPWLPMGSELKKGSGCPKCSNSYKYTEQETLDELNTLLKGQYTITGFVDGFKGTNSRCIVTCEKHGNGLEWGNPWNPTVSELKRGKQCPKCSNKYKYTEQETINELNETFKGQYTITGFIDGFKTQKSRCEITCNIHGKGSDWETPWNPKIKDLKDGRGCPKCSNERIELNNCLQHPQQFEKQRTLYFVTFKDLTKNKLFYKVGLATENGIHKRFKKCNLVKDNIEIIDSIEIQLSNINALISEYWILRHFADFRKPMFHVLKNTGGGSECFGSDISQSIPVQDMINNALKNKSTVLNDFELNTDIIDHIQSIK